jgi:N-acetylmuramoyl-L-alanine amidase CwlA
MEFLGADASNYRAGRTHKIKYIVVHYTGNKGDTARENCVYYHGAGRDASAHYFVDENEIWQSVADEDTAWHCGTKTGIYYHPECRNSNSVGVEMCSDWSRGEYIITEATQARAAGLVRRLMRKYGVDAEHVVRHYDVTHKSCPRPFVEHPGQWAEFRKRLEDEMTQSEFDSMMEKYLSERDAGSVSDYAQAAWAKAVAAGTVNGTAPRGFLTREQLIAVLERIGLNK